MILGLDFIVILKKALLHYHMVTTGINGLKLHSKDKSSCGIRLDIYYIDIDID